MKVLVFTNDNGPESREALELGASLEQENFSVEYHKSEESGSAELQELYDIVSYPSFVVSQDDGSYIERWSGIVPLESDIRMFLG